MSNPYDPLLTFEEAGELLGTGPDLPRRLAATGRLGHVRHGDDTLIPESALITYLTTDPDPSESDQGSAIARDDAA